MFRIFKSFAAWTHIFPKLGNKYIVDADQKNFLPLLNMAPHEGGKK